MKNINSFMSNSCVVELNSTEMNEIVGGSFLGRLVGAFVDMVVEKVAAVLGAILCTDVEVVE